MLTYQTYKIISLMEIKNYPPLTIELAKHVATIINIDHPEWGVQRFNYNDQPLNDNSYAHTWGTGSNSAVLFEGDFKYWAVVSFKSKSPIPLNAANCKFTYESYTKTIRLKPFNSLILCKHKGRWLADMDLAVDTELAVKIYRLMHEWENRYAPNPNILVERLNTLLTDH
jgi:hypothetical protein